MNRISKAIYIILFGGIMAVISCTPRPEPIELDSVLAQAEFSTRLSDTQFNSSNMKLGKMVIADFHQSVSATGVIDVPPENTTTVSVYFGGYIKELSLLPGQKIQEGQVLMIMENPEYLQIQQEYLEAKGQIVFLEDDFERQGILVKDSVISTKKYLKAEADYKVELARFESLKKTLALMNIDAGTLTEKNMRSTITVRSPMSGFITAVDVTKGMYVGPATDALIITNTEHLHLELTIFEQDLPGIKKGLPIKFRVSNNPAEYMAEVFLVNRSIDIQKRTISIHGHLVNEEKEELFAPGMYVEAQILTSTKQAPALPQEAVVNVDEKYYALTKVELGTGTFDFERKEIEPGMVVNGFVEILNHEAFDKDTEFLIKGAFNLIKD